uniref:Uncharacterized protein n=1 Tax=Acrobeloides nanus TaxID=290746 RepID=A0A914CG40_9BILA
MNMKMNKFVTLIAFLCFCGLSQTAIFDHTLDVIPKEFFPLLFPIGEAPSNPCDQIALNAAQANFNTRLNISTDVTWRNATYLNTQVRQLFSNGTISSLQLVCYARDIFESTLRPRGYYDSCLSRYFLMNQPGADWYTVMTYIMFYQHLDLLCNQAFEKFVQLSTWSCIHIFETDAGNLACLTAFNNSVITGGYQNLCSDVSGFMTCEKAFWDNKCNSPVKISDQPFNDHHGVVVRCAAKKFDITGTSKGSAPFSERFCTILGSMS